MGIKSLCLRDFRNYDKKDLEFKENTTWITGSNGSGKTNILEAIYLLATGKSNRVGRHEEIIKWGKEVATIEGHIVDQEIDVSNSDVLEIVITRGEIQGRKVMGKQYKVNGVGRHQQKFVGNLRAVWFGPEDLDLIGGSASRRRNYLDEISRKMDKEYERALKDYEDALRRRNKMLGLLSEGKVKRDAFGYFDQIIVNAGKYLQIKRHELIDSLNEWLNNDVNFRTIRLKYDESKISWERLKQYEDQEVRVGNTLVGPHKDDLIVEMNFGGENYQLLEKYGSRGQMRIGALALKLGELEVMSAFYKSRPILLLDDVLSELDEVNQNIVIKAMEKQQTIVTGVDKFI